MARPPGTRKCKSYLALRRQDYDHLQATARRVWGKLPAAFQAEVTEEDLIDYGWDRVFSACKTYEVFEKSCYINGCRAMYQYARYLFTQRIRHFGLEAARALGLVGYISADDGEEGSVEAEFEHPWDKIGVRLDLEAA